jgi:hypothetical protein
LQGVVEKRDVCFCQLNDNSKMPFVNQVNELENQTLCRLLQLINVKRCDEKLETFEQTTEHFLEVGPKGREHYELFGVHDLI